LVAGDVGADQPRTVRSVVSVSAGTIFGLVIGLGCLVAGAELLVRGAAAIATRLGVQPVVIGLTVVAFGTSAPELAVSVGSAISGNSDVAFGNVAGSNIVNILLVLGASAVVGGLAVSQRIVRIDVPLLVGVSIVALLMSLDNRIGRVDGVILFSGVIAYTWWLIRASRREIADISQEYAVAIESVEGAVVERPILLQIALVVVGLVVLVVGSQLLVNSATDIAESLGVSDLVIGLTVVAIGTSLPELATSILAAFRGQRDIAVGNVVGSCLFNLMGVLGLTGIVSPDGVNVGDSSLSLDFPVMIAATIVLVPIMWNGFQIKRWAGLVLAAFYVVYIAFLVLDEGDSTAADIVAPAALIAATLVLMTFAVTGYQGWRRHTAMVHSAEDA